MALPNVDVQVSGLPSKLVKDLQLYMQSSLHITIRGSQNVDIVGMISVSLCTVLILICLSIPESGVITASLLLLIEVWNGQCLLS